MTRLLKNVFSSLVWRFAVVTEPPSFALTEEEILADLLYGREAMRQPHQATPSRRLAG